MTCCVTAGLGIGNFQKKQRKPQTIFSEVLHSAKHHSCASNGRTPRKLGTPQAFVPRTAHAMLPTAGWWGSHEVLNFHPVAHIHAKSDAKATWCKAYSRCPSLVRRENFWLLASEIFPGWNFSGGQHLCLASPFSRNGQNLHGHTPVENLHCWACQGGPNMQNQEEVSLHLQWNDRRWFAWKYETGLFGIFALVGKIEMAAPRVGKATLHPMAPAMRSYSPTAAFGMCLPKGIRASQLNIPCKSAAGSPNSSNCFHALGCGLENYNPSGMYFDRPRAHPNITCTHKIGCSLLRGVNLVSWRV